MSNKSLLDQDKSSWVDGHCVIPLQSLLINSNGDIFLCVCESFLPVSIGNILEFNNWEEFLHRFNNNPVRDSILDRSYKFCRGDMCAILQQKFAGESPGALVDANEVKLRKLRTLRLLMDNSCNLSCPTCRPGVIINHHPAFVEVLKKKLNQLDKIFFDPLRIDAIQMDGSGEFLASKTIFNWMLEKATTGVKFELISNGTLISQYREKIETILKATNSITISIDGSNKEIFETTRRGSNWEKMLEGLHLLNELREKTNFWLNYHFTVSSANYFDIPNFLEFVKVMKPNHVSFNKVERWVEDDQEWERLNVFDSNHPDYNNLIETLKNVSWPTNSSRNFTHKI